MRQARQSAATSDQRRAECESTTAQLRVAERRLDEVRRVLRDTEEAVESKNLAIKSLEVDKERLKHELNELREEDEQVKHQAQLLRTGMSSEIKQVEELRRKAAEHRSDCASLQESESRMVSAVTQLKSSLDTLQAELSDTRAAHERERRGLSDLLTKRSMLESELTRLTEELKFGQEYITEQHTRRAETEAALVRAREDTNRAHRDLILAQKKLHDAKLCEEDIRLQQKDAILNKEKLLVEYEGINSTISLEKLNIEKAKDTYRDMQIQLRKLAEDVQAARKDQQSEQVTVNTLRVEQVALEKQRDALKQEVTHWREAILSERQRFEKLEGTYAQIETRLGQLRSGMTATEQSYEQLKHQSQTEAQRVLEQRRILTDAADELAHIESSIATANKQLHEEKQRAIFEISQLGQAKHSAQQQAFLAHEAQRRLEAKATAMSGIGLPIAQQQQQPPINPTAAATSGPHAALSAIMSFQPPTSSSNMQHQQQQQQQSSKAQNTHHHLQIKQQSLFAPRENLLGLSTGRYFDSNNTVTTAAPPTRLPTTHQVHRYPSPTSSTADSRIPAHRHHPSSIQPTSRSSQPNHSLSSSNSNHEQGNNNKVGNNNIVVDNLISKEDLLSKRPLNELLPSKVSAAATNNADLPHSSTTASLSQNKKSSEHTVSVLSSSGTNNNTVTFADATINRREDSNRGDKAASTEASHLAAPTKTTTSSDSSNGNSSSSSSSLSQGGPMQQEIGLSDLQLEIAKLRAQSAEVLHNG